MRAVTRVDRASRLIRASAAALYRAFLDPGALVRWLPPEGMAGEVLAFDPRPGGGYRMALRYTGQDHPPGKSGEDGDIVEVRFDALVPDRRIVQSAMFAAEDPAFAGRMTVTWTFEPAEGGTRVTVACTNVPQGIAKRDHEAGLKSSLANLAAFAERFSDPAAARSR